MGGNKRGGPSGNCVCTNCGERVAHQQDVPCNSFKCPKCGAAMMRSGKISDDFFNTGRKIYGKQGGD
jgi:predicted RNA-binding Zn-ribbon protein involved in translation (DUF1610 family)